MKEGFPENVAGWLAQMVEISCASEPQEFWRGVCGLLARATPYRLAAIWSNAATLLFEQGADGRIRRSPSSTEHAFDLRVGKLCTQLRESLHERRVRMIAASTFRGLDQHSHPYLRKHACDDAITLVFLHGNWVFATIALYRTAENRAALSDECSLESLHSVLQPLVLRHHQQTQQATLNAGMVDFLRHLPVGLAFYSWQNELLFANEEAHRQSFLWNAAPSRKLVKKPELRESFVIAPEIAVGLNVLREGRNAHVTRFEPVQITSLTISHPLEPQRQVVVSLTLDPDQPLNTPNFVVRFKGLNAPSVDNVFEPNSSQLSTLAKLTGAERAVAILVMKGLDNQSIAAKLRREVSTVKFHLTQIYAKLGVKSRAQLISLSHMG